MEPSDLEIHHLGKSIAGLTILEDINLTITPGEVVALVGSSGAGKTTLINLIARILEPDQGEIRIEGIPVSEITDRRRYARLVGVIRQQFDLVGQLPVIHNVLAGRFNQWGLMRSLWSLIRPQEKDVALQALRRVGIADKSRELTAALSGGEQQRAALARLLVQSPRIVLADEPVASLDPVRAAQILGLLRQLCREDGHTLLVSLHSTEFIADYFDRVIGLKGGRIFLDKPASAVTSADLADLYEMEDDAHGVS